MTLIKNGWYSMSNFQSYNHQWSTDWEISLVQHKPIIDPCCASNFYCMWHYCIYALVGLESRIKPATASQHVSNTISLCFTGSVNFLLEFSHMLSTLYYFVVKGKLIWANKVCLQWELNQHPSILIPMYIHLC